MPKTPRPQPRLAKFRARVDELSRTAQCRQRLFVPTPGDAWRALSTCFAAVTGSADAPMVLTKAGDGIVATSYRVDLNEYEQWSTLLLPGDVCLAYGTRDDVVQPSACEISLTAATPEVAATAMRWLVEASAPLLGLVITTLQELPAPAVCETWTSRDWTIRVSSMSPSAGRQPIHDLFVPHHRSGPGSGARPNAHPTIPRRCS
ncbi:MAG: hypothetical protein NT062_32070 [Proteobacteria bacterium]|nr:hypothetical protein [Pseudomonadota bacterium]